VSVQVDSGCAAPAQEATPEDFDTKGQVVIAGTVTAGSEPVSNAYVRLLDRDGEFVGEVQASEQGEFRFYAASGKWTVRALHAKGKGEAVVETDEPKVYRVAVDI